MNLQLNRDGEVTLAEAAPDVRLFPDAGAVSDLIEFALNNRVARFLLHSSNLSAAFFDLKTGMAGEALQKWRQYRLRVAVVLSRELEVGERFKQLILEENKGPFIHFCPTEAEA